ncbi:alkaline phosphatase PhoX [Methyloprofundus sp.]|uniref:alkaline phosphatase PhoX n=1 Tax=Methyloprofundus sp. TaxID=2020875 RepID=UPI003D10D4A7
MRFKILAVMVPSLILGAPVAQAEDALMFSTAPVPTNDLDKRSILTSQYLQVGDYKADVKFNAIMRSGDNPEGSIAPFGTIFDIEGQNIVAEDGSVRVSSDNDFSSLITGEDNKLYMVSHFETRPAAVYLTELDQNTETGKLTAKKTRPLDFSHVNGGWVHCAGSVSPWGNHIGSEEYPPNAKQWRDNTIDDYNAAMVRYFPAARGATDEALPALALEHMNPYDYGYTLEVDVKDFTNTSVVKHYSMGRIAIELSYVMPNEKTVYTSDDGSYVGLFRFEADNKQDLSSGELFAAKFTQTSPWTTDEERIHPLDGGAGTLSWISLGEATDAEVRAIIDSGVTFTSIFSEDVDGCTSITAGYGEECLKINPGMEKAASRLETRRYAALMGATVEWEKMEGITLDESTNTMYLGMSRVRNGMSDGLGDMSVPFNYCGTVYALDLDENYLAKNIYGVVSGIPRLFKRGAVEDNPYAEDGPYSANECDVNAIAEPDNITFIPDFKTLIIGEDSGKHQNDMVWSYNVESKSLTRIQTTPYGSETTSPYFYRNLNGFSYLMSVIQHPFGESDKDALKADEEARGYTGYLGPWMGY